MASRFEVVNPLGSDAPQDNLTTHIWDGVAFSFDPNKGRFVMGDNGKTELLTPSEIMEIGDLSQYVATHGESVGITNPHYLYLLSSGDLAQLPAYRAALATLAIRPEERRSVMADVKEVIRETYKAFDPLVVFPKPKIDERSGFVDRIGAQINSDGLFIIQTLGNYTCIENDPNGYGILTSPLTSPLIDISHPLVYGARNATSQAALVSLYAGAGALAHITRGLNTPSTSQ